ncbi:MAG: class 1 fructose-bisphosphatase [Cytophagales bacterium]|nr:class 1 fructose-bisphosphatase [Cytophagales bacterium]
MKKEVSSITTSIGCTLDQFIKARGDELPCAPEELSQLLNDITLAGKLVGSEVNKAGLVDITGAQGTYNIHGEAQQKLDVMAHTCFMRALEKGGVVCAITSEEEEDVVKLENNQGKYIVALDPLDGSSNIDVNVSIGTIFSIYHRISPIGEPVQPEDVLQRGSEQMAAGYLLYGTSTMLVYTTGHGVHGFTYAPSLGEFLLSHPNIKTPPAGKIYAINDGYFARFPDSIKSYIQYCRDNSYKARYIGSLVADFHRNLLKGGIYMYPPTESTPHGKLRLMFECNALAFIVEQAGGTATDGQQRIRTIEPTEIHQRVPLYIGSAKMVERLTAFYNK